MSYRNSTRSSGCWSSTSLTRKSVTARSVVAKASRNPERSPTRCSDSAASWTPAGHPSMRSCRRSQLGRRRLDPVGGQQRRRLLDAEAQLVAVQLQQSAATRRRASGNGGSWRLPITRRTLGGRASTSPASAPGAGRARWRSSMTTTTGRPSSPRSLATETARSWSSEPSRSRTMAASSPTPGHLVDTASSSPRQKRVGLGVAGVAGQPGRLVAVGAGPVGEQRRLAEPGRGRDQPRRGSRARPTAPRGPGAPRSPAPAAGSPAWLLR